MPRRKLTDGEKKKMAEARARSRKEKEAALEAVNNPQLCKASFWKAVDYDLMIAVEDAIEASKKQRKLARIKELEKELTRLKAE